MILTCGNANEDKFNIGLLVYVMKHILDLLKAPNFNAVGKRWL